jgi:hypothetical protein
MSEITRYPLCWPDNVPRTLPFNRGRPNFADRSIAYATNEIRAEINRLNQRRHDYEDTNVIISTNLVLKQDGDPHSRQSEPRDSGVAVFFKLRFYINGKSQERQCVLTCDRWLKIADNMLAIAKDIYAQRARERWGCTTVEQAFRGYLAIPAKCGGKSWWDTLGVAADASAEVIEKAYKTLSMSRHPDKGGTAEQWDELQRAHEQGVARFRTESR